MPTGLWDVHDRAEVFTPHEIEAGKLQCQQQGMEYIADPHGRAIPLSGFVAMLEARWMRVCQTARLFEHLKAGYCSVAPVGTPPGNDTRH